MQQPSSSAIIKPLLSADKSAPWVVLGAGSIGLLAASRWAMAQQRVSLWLKDATPTELAVRFQQQGRDIPLLFTTSRPQLVERVLITVKAFDVLSALDSLQPYLSADAQIVLSHNGMGTLEQVASRLTAEQGLWFASTTHGAFKPSALHICHTGLGRTVMAPCNAAARQSTQPIAAWLDSALGPVQQVDDIQRFLWQKLAINAVINPLTALHDCRNGALAATEYAAQIQQLIAEFVILTNTLGMDFRHEELQDLIAQVIQQTANNYSSMQQDVAAKRSTELAAITGFVLQQAQQLQLHLPAHQAVYQALTATLADWQYR